jgi:cell division protein FtsB
MQVLDMLAKAARTQINVTNVGLVTFSLKKDKKHE